MEYRNIYISISISNGIGDTMKGNAKVQIQKDKKRNRTRYLIYIPSEIVKALAIKKGNRVDFDIGNPLPDRIEEIGVGKNFKSKEGA